MAKRNLMFRIAYALESGNPFAYLLIFMIMYPPIMVIIFAIIDKFKRH